MTKQNKGEKVNGWRGYLITVFAITVAVVYGPVARRWLISQGIDEYSAGVWAALSGLAVAAAGVWLMFAVARMYAANMEVMKHALRQEKEHQLKLSQESREDPLIAQRIERFREVDTEELRHQWIKTPYPASEPHRLELKRRGYFEGNESAE